MQQFLWCNATLGKSRYAFYTPCFHQNITPWRMKCKQPLLYLYLLKLVNSATQMYWKLKSSSYIVPCILFNVVQSSGIAVHFEYRNCRNAIFGCLFRPVFFDLSIGSAAKLGMPLNFINMQASVLNTGRLYSVCVSSSDIYLDG